MFHNKLRLPDDKQYYYEFNATGMDQFGVKMIKLWIKQVSGIIFILKIIFYYNLPSFLNPWIAHINSGKPRVEFVNNRI
jgi:hypothetical protein